MFKSHPDGIVFESVKWAWRGAEAWHHIVGLEFLEEGQEKLSVKVRVSCNRKLLTFWRCPFHGLTAKGTLNLRDKLCVLPMAEPEKWPKDLSQGIVNGFQTPRTELLDLVSFDLIVTVSQFFPLGVRKFLTLFFNFTETDSYKILSIS